MRKMIVTGHLGGDPEVKATKGGINYTTFRIANSEYGEENASWISVTVWDSAMQNFCKNLKKGSSVIIDGDYSDRVYTSNKTGQPEIGRDIRANAIYFGALPKKEEDTTAQPQVASTPKSTSTPKAAAVAPAAPSANVMPAEDDDLPF